MSDEPVTGGAFYAQEALSDRVWRALGFRHGHVPRLDEEELGDGWTPGCFVVETYVHLDFLDRLRVLLSGNLHLDHAIKTDVPIGRSHAAVSVGILRPGVTCGR